MSRIRNVILIALFAVVCFAQPFVPPSPVNVTSLPSTCFIGQSVYLVNGYTGVYRCITTNTWGYVESTVATVDLTGKTADVTTTTAYAVPAGAGGSYVVDCYVVLTTAGSVSSTMPKCQIAYTDMTSSQAVSAFDLTATSTANTVGTNSAAAGKGTVVVSAKAGTNISFNTASYASSAAGAAFAMHVKVRAVGP